MKNLDETTQRKIKTLMESFKTLRQRSAAIDETCQAILDSALTMVVPKPDKYCDYVVGDWECRQSPLGKCVYYKREDPAFDDCIYCHEPHDRA